MKKRVLSMLMVMALGAGMLAGCGKSGGNTDNSGKAPGSDNDKNVYAIVDKNTTEWCMKDVHGFTGFCEEVGYSYKDGTVAETSVSAQVQAIDELITEGVAGIAINANGDTGFEQILKKAQEAGIKTCSYDARLAPDQRVTHINQTTNEDAGKYMLRLGVLAALRCEYDENDPDMTATLKKALEEYTGPEIQLGIISAGVDAPVQNAWLVYMEEELAEDMYKGKVNPQMDIKYGNDDVTESGNQASAFLAEDKVDVIICISGAAPQACVSAFEGSDTDIKVTGCGLPSWVVDGMPSADEDYWSKFIPHILLWDLNYMGATAAAVLEAAVEDGFDGSVGSKLTIPAFDRYEERTLEVTECDDGGTEVVIGAPVVFTHENVEEWAKIL